MKEQAEQEKELKPILEELKPEIDALHKNNTSMSAVLKYLVQHYKPRNVTFVEYNKKAKEGSEDDKSDDDDEDAAETKHYMKILKQALVFFHADKVSKEPKKVQVLYERITQVLTSYINSVKGL